MKPDELDDFIAETLAEHLAAFKLELEDRVDRAVAARPLPPFMPPPVWTEGKHGAGTVVRAMGGLFMARRDTASMPLLEDDGAWLPLVVGLAGFDMRWVDDHKFVCMAHLSDGRVVTTEREIPVPIVRGYWEPEATYMPGDRVFRYGEHHCLKMSLGIDPTSAEADGHWEKVGGKYARSLVLAVTQDGDITESGRVIGSVKPMIKQLLSDLLEKRAA
jgi:hypothetical protein